MAGSAAAQQRQIVAQPQSGSNGITQPVSGASISGVVTVTGTAVDPNYLRYELAFRSEAGTSAEWIVFAEGDQPIRNGILAIWDTTVGRNVNAPVWPDGRYQLRLRVVRTDYNYDEYFVTGLTISNSGTPTPTPTITGTMTVPATTVAQPAGTSAFAPLTPIPSLTPFPTPTSFPTPVNASVVDEETGVQAQTPRGLVGQLEQVDVTPLTRAFWQGTRVTIYLFVALALYVVLRAVGRWLWQLFWHKMNDRREL